jgi:guanine deaminase
MAVDSSGRILSLGPATEIRKKFSGSLIEDFGEAIICPGFVDAHTHFPQLQIVGSFGETLLGWLDKYTFPEESRFADAKYARAIAKRFTREMLRNGTTCAAVFSTSHREATEIYCEESLASGMRAIVGKCSMDQNAPSQLLKSIDQDLSDLHDLISKWHGRDDLIFCAITPRFAPSCSETMLQELGVLRKRHPGVYVQSHISENLAEIDMVHELFPADRDYFAVYERFNLTGPRSLYAHGVHLTDDELQRMGESKTALIHCPSSNAFLGSGLIDLRRVEKYSVPIAFATDIGGGTSFSMLRTQLDAYKIQKLGHHVIHPVELFFHATLGGATTLNLDHLCGNFATGKAADFIVIDSKPGDLLYDRLHKSLDPDEKLFALATIGGSNYIDKVFVQGKLVHERQPK